MTNPPPPDFFNREMAAAYDERNRSLTPISEGLHFLIRLILSDLPERSRVLCVGVGTGAEILSLAKAYPNWEFVGVDPSGAMLEVCRQRLHEAGIADRCNLVHGYVNDLPASGGYDAVLSVLVAHFIGRNERAKFFGHLTSQLRSSGTLVNAEISFDLESPQADSMIEQWKKIQTLMGGTPESLTGLPRALREVLTVLPPSETQRLITDSGIAISIPFFQSFMIQGWYGKK